MSINSPLTWLHGGIGDQGFQTLNFQRFGSVSPLMQPRLDTSMLGLQPDVYQVMEAASFQDTGSLDPSKLSKQSLHIQPTVSASLIRNQMLHQSHSQPKLFFQDNNAVSQAQILQLNQHFNDDQEQMNKHMMVNGSQPQVIPLHNLLGLSENHATSYQSLVSSFRHEGALQSPSSKRVALEPQLAEFGVVNPQEVVCPNSKVFDLEGAMDPQNILYGVDTRAMLVNGVSGYRNSGNAYVSGEFGVESDYLQCSENVDPSNPVPGTFVKVEKSGSLGGSVDISKFRSYDELRSEVAGMFGLEGVLDEHERSGWQLVFVDRENDVLLLGDDPWQEFVNSVWYIKILSPLQVQHLGKQHLRSHCDHHSTFNANPNGIPSPLLMP